MKITKDDNTDTPVSIENLAENTEATKKEKKSKKDKKSKKEHKSKKEKKSSKSKPKETAVVDGEHASEEPDNVAEIPQDKHAMEEDESIHASRNEEEDNDKCVDPTVSDIMTGDERKIFLSRIPSILTEDSIIQSLERIFGENSVEHVALVSEVKRHDGKSSNSETDVDAGTKENEDTEHRGFAFVTMSTIEKRNEAIDKGTIKAKVKETSKRKYTLYIRPVVRSDSHNQGDNSNEDMNVCYLWKMNRCPYGNDCKFQHIGEGGCEEKNREQVEDKRSKQKCFSYRTKGKCKLGDDCPYSHDFEPKKITKNSPVDKTDADKDCINWKTKGKCRKGDKCIYRHDEAVRAAFLAKKQNKTEKKKRGREEKSPQPLSVRVFGLNYDTTEEDVREYFQHCGTIKEITFPTFEDSGRSKGYCGVLFVSPKATEKACELDGQELHGRWLSVQPGKMYLRQWEQREQDRKSECNADAELGEYGQKVKRRKAHGYKE